MIRDPAGFVLFILFGVALALILGTAIVRVRREYHPDDGEGDA